MLFVQPLSSIMPKRHAFQRDAMVISIVLAVVFALEGPALGQGPQVNESIATAFPESVATPTAERIDEFLQSASRFGFSGQVLVEKNGKIILHRSYGFADTTKRTPINEDTVFGIASMSKQFTATAILLLESDGKLDVTDPIGTHFPSIPLELRSITIHQLLTHTSGLPYTAVPDDWGVATRQELLRKTFDLRPTPGHRKTWRYSNAGYNLLAEIVSRVSGIPFHKYLHERLFGPAGMTNTHSIGHDVWKVGSSAHAYWNGRDQGNPQEWKPNWRTYGAGGVVSSVSDLLRWDRALRDGRILPPTQLDKLYKGSVSVPGGSEKYAYGWFVHRLRGRKQLIEHGGDTELGFNGVIRRYPEDKLYIALLSNRRLEDGMWARWGVQDQIATIAREGNSVTPLPWAQTMTVQDLERLTGEYRLGESGVVDIRLDGNELLMFPIGQQAVEQVYGFDASTRKRLKRHVRRTEELLEKIGKNPTEAYLKALAGNKAPLSDYVNEWNGLVAKHGPLKTATLVGVLPSSSGGAAYAMLEFASGVAISMRYSWSNRLRGTHYSEGNSPVVQRFAPESEDVFVNYDLTNKRVVCRLKHTKDDSGKVSWRISDND